jgi:UDP-glucose 4-epimerase
MFSSKKILITGGTGSFGETMLKHLLDSDINEIRIFSRDEKKQDDLRKVYNNSKLKFYLGDVRDYRSILNAVDGVDFIYHAAALKQVPSCEFHPMEAVKTNILGTENVIEAAINCKVSRVIVLSTDKAVYPINAMGISKAMMEKVAIQKSRASLNTVICITRYGNVMASRGSVIPLFISQIQAGQPITLTDPQMTRFMMTLDESVNLVLFALKHGTPGDIFVQKSPASTLELLVKALTDIMQAPKHPINIIGTRHGEKLYETLLTKEEHIVAQDMGGFFRISADKRDLNYDKYFIEGRESIKQLEDYNSHNTKRLKIKQIKDKLLELDYIREELKKWKKSS